MNPKLKRFLIVFVISTLTSFIMFYLFEENRACVFDWGSKCSKSYLFRASLQSVVLTLVLFFSNRQKHIDKQ